MIFTVVTTSILALFPVIAQAGRAIVTNQCDDTIYLWSVGGSIGPKVTLPSSSSYGEEFHVDPVSGGIALKMTPVDDGLFKPNVSQTIFSYNLDGENIWYDLSDVFGDGFIGKSLEVKPSESTCQNIIWPGGKPPGGSQVKVCGSGTDLTLTFCPGFCLPAWSPCGANAPPGETRQCCTHCIGSHHCIQA